LKSYLFATNRPWNVEVFMSQRGRLSGHWQVCVHPTDLMPAASAASPRYVFFPHWSHIVPASFLEQYECVCFHMTDVPYGRGGSPLQNLIARGHTETVLTALRMSRELDAGPVYMKKPLDLSGTAEEIFQRAAALSFDMMLEIVGTEPEPVEQTGEPVLFKRRVPAQSEIPIDGSLAALNDHIRMLDAAGYPHAFITHGTWMGQLTGACLLPDAVEARVRFTKSKETIEI
jgi:methionyl-tRNA formyltransferase